MIKYHPHIPSACPPSDADPASGKVYRISKSGTVQDDELLSWCELNRPGANPNECTHWGLSVWKTKSAAEHGRRVFKFFKKQYVIAMELDNNCGCLLATPSKNQPNHWTWWKAQNATLQDCEVILEPNA